MVQRSVSIAASLLTLGLTTGAQAQTFDHLDCRPVKDALGKGKHAVDLVPRDVLLPAESGCEVKTPAKVLCTPTAVTRLEPPSPGVAHGAEATAQLCYKVKCPKRKLEIAVDDRFGTRVVEVKAPNLLCTPLSGAPSTTTTTTPTSTTTTTTSSDAPVPPSPGCPLVNEVMTGGVSSGSEEFVEVLNPCAAAIDLAGARLVYRSAAGSSDSTLFAWGDGALLSPGGRLVYAGAAFTGARNGDLGAGLSGTGGGVAVRTAMGEVADSVGYGTATNAFVEGAPAPAPAAGRSLARLPDGADTNQNASDWTATTALTPGAVNTGS